MSTYPYSPQTPRSMATTSEKSNMSTEHVVGYTAQDEDATVGAAERMGAEHKVSARRKWMLLLIFCVSSYLDICGRSAFIVFVQKIADDLDIKYEDSIWTLNSYGVTFGSFLLLWGRVSDLYSAKTVFNFGFIGCAITSLIVSFMTNKVSFFIFRALYGVAASATIPSAFRLILAVFEPGEVHTALAAFGLSGALANATGLFGEIDTTTEQLVGWRWYARFVCFLSLPFALFSHFVTPQTRGDHANVSNKWRYLDIIGNVIILASMLLFNLALTFGSADGWDSPKFIAPLCVSIPLLLAFFIWEAKIDPMKAVLPPRIWKYPNMKVIIFVSAYLFAWVANQQLSFVERFELLYNESEIKAAVRVLPLGLGSCIFLLVASPIIKKLTSLYVPLLIGFAICAAAYVPLIYSHGELGSSYWKYLFPSFLIGSIGLAVAYLACNIVVMTGAPPTMAGTAGALFQLTIQLGIVTGYSIQDAFLSIHEGSVTNFKNMQGAFWFQFGWGAVCFLLVLVFYRSSKAPASTATTKAEEIAIRPQNENGKPVQRR